MVRERVWRRRLGTASGIGIKATTGSSSKPSTAAVAETSATAAKPATTESTSEAAAATSKSTTAISTGHAGAGEPVLSDLEESALPVIAVELLDRVSRIVRGLEYYYARALRPSVLTDVHVGTDDATSSSYHVIWVNKKASRKTSLLGNHEHLTSLAEKVLQILPAYGVRKLGSPC